MWHHTEIASPVTTDAAAAAGTRYYALYIIGDVGPLEIDLP